jgi:shikimate dehydrogenase
VIKYLDGLGSSAPSLVLSIVSCAAIIATSVRTPTDRDFSVLRTIADPAGKVFVLFGAGGAARAIAMETALAGAASITIVNRGPTRGSELVALVIEKTQARADLVGWDRAYRIPEASDIVVNATSIGLFPHAERVRLDLDSLHPALVVADVIQSAAKHS